MTMNFKNQQEKDSAIAALKTNHDLIVARIKTARKNGITLTTYLHRLKSDHAPCCLGKIRRPSSPFNHTLT